MTLHTTKEKLLQNFTLFLLFLAGMNVGNRYFYFLFAAAAVFFLFRQNIKMDLNALLLLLLSVSWVVFSPDSESLSLTTLIKPFLYPLTYLLGRNIFHENRVHPEGDREKRFRFFIIAIAAGPYMHYLLNYLNNSGFDVRNTIDIWTGTVLSATGQAVLGCMMLATAISILAASEKLTAKIMSGAVVVSILMYNLVLAGRTIWGITILISFFTVIFMYRESTISTERTKIILAVLLLLLLVYLIYIENIFGVREVFEQSNFFNRFFRSFQNTEELLVDRRMDKKIEYIKNFGMSIFGGRHLFNSGIGYAHDLYLDTYDEAGIFALFAISAFSISAVRKLIRCLKAKYLDSFTRLMVFNLYMTAMMIFMIEPILQGTPWFFLSFCFIHGVLVEMESLWKRDLLRKAGDDETVEQNIVSCCGLHKL